MARDLVGAVLAGWVFLNIAMLQRIDVSRALASLLVVVVGMVITRFLLRYNGYNLAAWVYVFSGLIALGIGMVFAQDQFLYIIPFAFPLMVFIVGLLLAPGNTLVVAVVSAVIIVIAPMIGGHTADNLGAFQIAAIVLDFRQRDRRGTGRWRPLPDRGLGAVELSARAPGRRGIV